MRVLFQGRMVLDSVCRPLHPLLMGWNIRDFRILVIHGWPVKRAVGFLLTCLGSAVIPKRRLNALTVQ